jgi:hypothetical protein
VLLPSAHGAFLQLPRLDTSLAAFIPALASERHGFVREVEKGSGAYDAIHLFVKNVKNVLKKELLI